MKPVRVSVHVPHQREQVYEFLAISANHETFSDHMLTDWSFSGPRRGVGSKSHVTAVVGGRRDPIDIEVIDDAAPARIVERNVGARGRRVATGTYVLTPAADGGTTVSFEYAWKQVPIEERLMSPVVRRIMRRSLETVMQRLVGALDVWLAENGRQSTEPGTPETSPRR